MDWFNFGTTWSIKNDFIVFIAQSKIHEKSRKEMEKIKNFVFRVGSTELISPGKRQKYP